MIRICALFLFMCLAISASAVEVRLTDGTVMKGEVTATSPVDVTIRTEYGIVRVPLEKLSAESRKALVPPRDLAGCEARVSELEVRIGGLEQENQDLRKRLADRSAAAPMRSLMTGEPSRSSDSGLGHSQSSTGKRHNSRCRYYEPDKPCSPNAGVACKICGG